MSTALWVAVILAVVVGGGGAMWAYWYGEIRSKQQR